MTPPLNLANAIEDVFQRIDRFISHTIGWMNIPRCIFSEQVLLPGRPMISKAAGEMMKKVYRFGLQVLSPNPKLRFLCEKVGIIGHVVEVPQEISSDYSKKDWCRPTLCWYVPWKVTTDKNVEETNLRLIEEGRNQLIAFCPAETEESWEIDLFEPEAKRNSFMNRLLLALSEKKEGSILKRNLQKTVYIMFKSFIEEYFAKVEGKKVSFPDGLQAIAQSEFAPKADSTLEMAYKAVLASIKSPRARNYNPIKRAWREKLKSMMFIDLDWDHRRKKVFLKKLTGKFRENFGKGRWSSSHSISVNNYASFIKYFAHQFLEAPEKNPEFGEAVYFLLIAMRAAEDHTISVTLRALLALTVGDIDFAQREIKLPNNQVIQISMGVTNVLRSYLSDNSQRLFPHLTIDNIENMFHAASEIILPDRSLALPEAFLSFPHQSGPRVAPKLRKMQRSQPLKLLYKGPSKHQIQEELKLRIASKSS